jgi:uncharacterized protein YoxC
MAAAQPDYSGLLSNLIVFAAIAFGIFLLLREIICWYYKINRMVKVIESIDDRLDKVALASLAVLREIRGETHETNELMRQQQNRLAQVTELIRPPVIPPP